MDRLEIGWVVKWQAHQLQLQQRLPERTRLNPADAEFLSVGQRGNVRPARHPADLRNHLDVGQRAATEANETPRIESSLQDMQAMRRIIISRGFTRASLQPSIVTMMGITLLHGSEGDLGLKPETITELPVESLALAVLQNYAASKAWNRGNWVGGARRALGRGAHMHALVEAWAWLEARGLVAHDPEQSSNDARIITRAGTRALESGSLIEILAAERIGLALHPRWQER